MAEEAAASAVSQLKENDILVLGKGTSLALAHDCLVVKDEVQAKRQRRKICGIAIGGPPTEISIPYYNILWAEVTDDSLQIDYANPVSKKYVRVAKLQYNLGKLPKDVVRAWIGALLELSYGPAQRCKRAKVLVNPHAGPGGAIKIWEQEVKPLFDAARMPMDIVRTQFSGEAVGICESLDIDAYDLVIPCSGDGLPFEVINGLGKRPDARRALHQLAVAHIPCGSGNAMSCNLYGTPQPSLAALAIIKGVRMPMDLASVTQGTTRKLSFLSQSVGIIAEADLGTEHLRWLGAARFNVGLIQRVFSKKMYPCDIAMKVAISDKAEIKAHYKRERDEGDFTIRRGGMLGKSASSTNTTSLYSEEDVGDGLPPLRFGTVNDKVPSGWETASYDKLGAFYCGNMAYMAPDANFFPAACPNDGLLDVVFNDGDIPPLKYLDILASVGYGQFFDRPQVSYRKVLGYRLTPRNQDQGHISIDGEHVPFEPFQVEIHQGLGTVISKAGKYEAAGPPAWEKARS